MQQYIEIATSRSQRLIGLVAHVVAASTIFFFVVPAFLKWAGIAGIALSAFIVYRRLIRQEIIRLRVDPVQHLIELQLSGQPYFYRKYKVYHTRWFAILKLIDQQADRTLILNPDCFHSTESYRRLRFDLLQLERADAT